ncbi:MAG: flagellar basal body L-ring protein FlgH [Planctomycetota bacterium]
MNTSSRWRLAQPFALNILVAAMLATLLGNRPCQAQNGSLFQDGPPPQANPGANASPMSPEGFPGWPSAAPGMGPALAPRAPGGPPNANVGNSLPYVGLPFGGGPAYVMGPGSVAGGNFFVPPSLQSSYTYQPPVPARVLRVNDIVSIRVEEIAQMIAQGNTTSRKTINFDAVLQDWIRMVGVDTIKPAPQSNGDPRVRFNENEVYRGDSTMRLAEQLTFNIAARIVDIQPNGNVVLEAKKTIEQSDNRFEASLSGICRAEDIGPNNVVLSRHIYDLKINRQDSGHVRDGYSRGWLTKWYARIKPF